MDDTRDKQQDRAGHAPEGDDVHKPHATSARTPQDAARSEPARTQSDDSSTGKSTRAASDGPAITTAQPDRSSRAAAQGPAMSAPDRKPPAAPQQRRTGSWFATLLALTAVSAAGYAVFRVQTEQAGAARLQDDLEAVRSELRTATAARDELRGEIARLRTDQQSVDAELRRRLDSLTGLPGEVAGLRSTIAEVRRQADVPRQTTALVEARTLLEMAEHRLAIDRDVTAATTALETADRLLAAVEAPAIAAVRDRIASDLAALRAVPQPDRTTLSNRLTEAERQAATLPLALPVTGEPAAATQTAPTASGPERAWTMIREAFSDLITVRRTGDADALVSADLAAMRRQHLALLLLAARTSLLRADQAAYEASLSRARAWLERHFASDTTAVVALRDELTALEQIDVAPGLPDISGAADLLADVALPTGDIE